MVPFNAMDLLLTDARIATMAGDDYGVIDDGAIAISDGKITWIGPQAELPDADAEMAQSMAGRWITPALIDCHTHLVFAGDRSGEFEARLRGASYEDIARAGGGIMSTVRATRKASADEPVSYTHLTLPTKESRCCCRGGAGEL